jgi:hypothetical protein
MESSGSVPMNVWTGKLRIVEQLPIDILLLHPKKYTQKSTPGKSIGFLSLNLTLQP